MSIEKFLTLGQRPSGGSITINYKYTVKLYVLAGGVCPLLSYRLNTVSLRHGR